MRYRLSTSSLIILSFILIPALSFAEPDWYWLHPTPTGASIHGSFFIDSENGWISTANALYITHDGGESWEEGFVWSWSNPRFRDIFFIDSLEGWACAYGLILHTTDGGSTWDIQTSEFQVWFKSIHFVNSECGYAVGHNSTVVRTDNGGDTWYRQTLSDHGHTFEDVFFVDSTTGWIAGLKSSFFFTNTAGSSWIEQPTGIIPLGSYDFLWFNDSQTGWAAAATGEIIATSDGGENWVQQYSEFHWLSDFDFADLNHGVACCSNSAIIRTDDGGETWVYEIVPHELPDPPMLYTISYPDAASILTAGVYGLIFKRTEVARWETLSNNMILESQRGICHIPPGNIWVCGLYDKIMHSADNGLTWEFQTLPLQVEALNDMCFLDSNTGYACGHKNNGQGVVIRTFNGGSSWEILAPPPSSFQELYSLDFVSYDSGVAVGAQGEVIRTFDGGTSWVKMEQLTYKTLNKFRFGDADHGWAVGDDGIVLRCDFSSDSWSLQYSSTGADMYSLFALNADTAWAGGWNGTIIRTHNGGDNWYKIGETGNDYQDIWFFNGNYGYFAGGGNVWITENGGNSLYGSTASRNGYIRYFCFSDPNNGWGCGENGHILRYGEGGTSVEDQTTSCISSSLNLSISPNPFVSLFSISFDLPEPSQARLSVYDISGRVVMALDPDYMNEREQNILLDGARLQPGIYLVRLEYNGQVSTSSCVRLR